jgi:hypothetical protein
MLETDPDRTPRRALLEKISNYFNVSMDYLLNEDIPVIDAYSKLNKSESCVSEIDETPCEPPSLIDTLLNNLIANGIIKDPDNIDDDTAKMIIDAVKLDLKLRKGKEGY